MFLLPRSFWCWFNWLTLLLLLLLLLHVDTWPVWTNWQRQSSDLTNWSSFVKYRVQQCTQCSWNIILKFSNRKKKKKKGKKYFRNCKRWAPITILPLLLPCCGLNNNLGPICWWTQKNRIQHLAEGAEYNNNHQQHQRPFFCFALLCFALVGFTGCPACCYNPPL